MSKLEEIRKKAIEILGRDEYKEGMRFANLIRKIAEETGDNINTINGSTYNMPNEMPKDIVRPQRGLFILKKNLKNMETKENETSDKYSDKFKEEDVYEPAKEYMLGHGECTHAIVVGGAMFAKKWGTPDLMGAIRVSSDAIYQPPIEIMAIEVKGSKYSPVEALGQAMAYKLFAHRTWLILPETDDIDRIEGIAMSANIGLIVFNYKNGQFIFETLNRPVTGNPDAEEVNKILNDLKEKDKSKFNDLIKVDK
jgi:hypothetical protein